jgi:hypothetical protein
MTRSVQRKITATKNYRLFARSEDNRNLDLRKHKKLYDSMKEYGFLACFPVVVVRDAKGGLVVKDGQHRVAIAEELQLPVYYVEETVDFDVALVNSTPKGWTLRDYAEKWAEHGVAAYQEGLDFSEQHKLPLGIAFALLAGVASWKDAQDDFVKGKFRIKDRPWADRVASIFSATVALSKAVNSQRFISACMAVCRVENFEVERFIHSAQKCREKLVSYATRDAYLEMMEAIYNYNRTQKHTSPLKYLAVQVVKERNPITRKAKAKAKAPAV